jgi:hypothetical protein
VLSGGASVSAVIRWNARLSCFVEAHLLGAGERDAFLQRLDYYAAVADASLNANNLSGAVVIVLALRSVMKLFKKDSGLARISNQKRWAYLSTLADMDLAATEVFLERFRGQEAAMPWVQPFAQSVSVISAEEPDTIALDSQRAGAVNFRKCARLWRLVHVYAQFQALEPPPRLDADAEGSRLLNDYVWSAPDMPLSRLQLMADRIASQAARWTAPRSPRGGAVAAAGVSDSMPTLGRRKSNADDPTQK